MSVVDTLITRLADGQHGVFATRQALELGIGPTALQRRVADGRLHAVHRAVYRVGRIDVRGRWMAAVLALGRPVGSSLVVAVGLVALAALVGGELAARNFRRAR